jgi:hypothetical protein
MEIMLMFSAYEKASIGHIDTLIQAATQETST